MANALQLNQEPICPPNTIEAKFLRDLDVSPNASQEQLQFAASEYNSRFGYGTIWQQMPELLRWARGEVPPQSRSRTINNGNGKGSKGLRPLFIKKRPELLP